MKSEFPVNDILITNLYTIIIGDELNYIIFHVINHNYYDLFDNTHFLQTFTSNFYKHLMKLNSENIIDPLRYYEHYFDYYLAYNNYYYTIPLNSKILMLNWFAKFLKMRQQGIIITN